MIENMKMKLGVIEVDIEQIQISNSNGLNNLAKSFLSLNLYKKILFCSFSVIASSLLVKGQSVEFKQYNYISKDYYSRLNFSIDIPINWVINTENDGTGYFLNCKQLNYSDIENKNDCFNSQIFRIKFFKSNLD